MNDILLMQVAMEASAVPPPASSASNNNSELSGDASFDSKLEKAMNDQPDAETLALATEAVVVPMQTTDTQPMLDGEVVEALETEALAIAQKVYALVDSQAQPDQPVLAAIINPDAGVNLYVGAEEAAQAAQPAQAAQAAQPAQAAQAAQPAQDTQAAQAVLPEAQANAAITSEIVAEIPVLVEAAKMQLAKETAGSQENEKASLPTNGAQPQKTGLPLETASNGERTAETTPAEVPGITTVNAETKSQPLIEVAVGNNHQMQADTADASTASKAAGKTLTEADSAEIKIDLAKIGSPPRQSTQAENAQVTADTAETAQPPVVDDNAGTMHVPVTESRKVKSNLGAIEGESPGQVSTGNRAVQSLDAQVKEPARLAEARTPEMINQITRSIDLLSRSDGQSLRIQLQPENLGKIEIRLTSRADGVTVTLNTDIPMTGSMLERNLSELRTSLADAGVNLASLSVNSGQKQATYQESKQWHSGKESRNSYPNQTNTVEDLPSAESAWKDSAIDYRI